jgi:5'(3')-deoxyribonucleotidase
MSSTEKNEQFRILIDLDGVCADIHTNWYEMYNRDYDDNVTVNDILSWDTHKYVKEECGKDIYRYLSLPGFFYMAPPVEGCMESLKALHDAGIELIICTASPILSQTGCYEKMQWAQKHFPFIDQYNFIATHRKDLIKGDVLLDDGPHNLEAFSGIPVAFRRPWNASIEYEYAVNTWPEFTELALLLANKKKSTTINIEDAA